ncbi:hypothetical protein PG985_003756 [Apiospora marii]|uniref:Nucleotidyl transferase AbiEii/AbiGii toxin family protein n=1 Tax=Apiospora marii TaxID=335849 RepID=A0ABR1SH71_9PEZI
MPSRQQLIDAAAAVAVALDGKVPYALVGGGACVVLGSQRATEEDIEIVVPKGRTSEARSLLKEHPASFDIESKTLHTYFKSGGPGLVRVELLAPPGMFREDFTEATPTICVGDGRVRVLKPVLLLNAKCGSVQERPNQERMQSDAVDIVFLLGWCRRNGVYPTADDVPNATRALVDTFVSLVPSKEHWVNAGYDMVRA